MNRKITGTVFTVLMLLTACGGASLRPGRMITSDLPTPEAFLDQKWPDGAMMLLQAGYPVEATWFAREYRVSSGDPLLITASSPDFAPILALVGSDGRLYSIANCTGGTDDAMLAVRDVPQGARLFVFAPDDRRGAFRLDCTALTTEETGRFSSNENLDSGRLEDWLPLRRDYLTMAGVLEESFEDMVYCDNLETARIHPFSVGEETLVTLDVTEADFDPVMVLVGMGRERYFYIDHNDDTDGLLPMVSNVLEPGSYAAVILGYSIGEGGRYSLSLEKTPFADLVSEVTSVNPGERASSPISAGANLAVMFWPDLLDAGWETNLTPSSPTAPFLFTIDETGVYSLSAEADIDVCMTLLRDVDGVMEYVDYNDDAMSEDVSSTDSRLDPVLLPGDYTALVSSYYDGDEADVRFRLEYADEDLQVLQPGQPVEVALTFGEPSVYYSFELIPANTYTITAEDDELDPMIEVYLPDGTLLFDDDGGGDLNSYLMIVPEDHQAGTCLLMVTSYWSDAEGTITVEMDYSPVI